MYVELSPRGDCMNRRIMSRSLALMLLVVVVGWIAVPRITWGQQVTAAITGVVTDPSGAPIANASVTAADTLRGTVWTTQTNDSGAYNLRSEEHTSELQSHLNLVC